METGNRREPLVLKVGFAESKVIAINPDNKKLRELGYNIDEDKEDPEYTKEKEGVDTVRIDFYMQEVKSGYKYKRTFFLEDKEVKTKSKDEDDDSFVPKYQYVNEVGDSFYAESENDLSNRFLTYTKKGKKGEDPIYVGDKEFRVAKVGEAALLNYIRKWLSKLNYYSPGNSLLLDLKQFFKGNFKELQEQINAGNDDTVVDLLEVNTVVKEGESKDYQSVWRTPLYGYEMRQIKATDFSEKNIDEWRSAKKSKLNPEGRYLKGWEELAIEVTDAEYGSKNYFVLAPMQNYDPSLNFAKSEESISETGLEY